MPNPDDIKQQNMSSIFGDIFGSKVSRMLNDSKQPDLLSEVMALRSEIAELRKELAPVPSLILTGREALDEFKKLSLK